MMPVMYPGTVLGGNQGGKNLIISVTANDGKYIFLFLLIPCTGRVCHRV